MLLGFGKRFLFRRLAFGDASQLFVVLCQLLTVRRQLLLACIQCRLELRELLRFFVLRAGQLRDLRFQRLNALLAGFELLLAGIQCSLEFRELLRFFVLRAGQLRDLRFQRLNALLAGFELLLGFGKRFLFRRLAFGNACQLFVVLCQLLAVRRQLLLAGIQCRLELRELLFKRLSGLLALLDQLLLFLLLLSVIFLRSD